MPVDRRRTRVLVGVLAILLCAAAGLEVAAAHGERALGPASTGTDHAVADYRGVVAPRLMARKEAVDQLAREIDTDPAVDRRADRYRDELLPRIAALLADTEAYRPPTAAIAAGHEHAVAALRLARQACQETERGYRAGGDPALLDRARHRADDQTVQWRRWLDAVLAL